MRRLALIVCVLFCSAAAFARFDDSVEIGRDSPAIHYASAPTNDLISELSRKMDAGQIHLKFDGARGYLRSVLEALNIPVESQMLIFSKTSVQASRINPTNPRALYFNSSAVVGWVRGSGFLEVASEDPQQGVVFYTLDQTPAEKPRFVRSNGCLTCHESYDSLGVPGMLLRSEFPSPSGVAMRELGSYVVDHRTPLEHRWGGWYVSGSSESIRNMGNSVVADSGRLEPMDAVLNPDSLAGKFPADDYPSLYSDIVAIMVFDHQMHMMNLLTRLNWQARIAQYHGQSKMGPSETPSTHNDLIGPDASVREFVDYLLFVDETPLASRIWGTSGFIDRFSSQGPRDRKERSLYELDLQGRLFRYPCSYMIYSRAFDGLPAEVKAAVYRRMWDILSGLDKDPKYARLSLADRRAIVEILRDTKSGLPEYFQAVAP